MKGYKYLALLLVIIFMLSACTKNKSSDVDSDLPQTGLSKDTSIEELLASMTLEEKVGQMVQGARDSMPIMMLTDCGLVLY